MEEMYDIIIIGGGPVGMFTAFYAGLRHTKVLLVEALADLGGQVQALYPDKKIWDVAGLPGVTGRELVRHLQKQLDQFDVTVQTGAKVTDLYQTNQGWHLVINGQAGELNGKTVILATGKGAFEPRRLQLDNEPDLVGQGLDYFAPDLSVYRNQVVAVLGGGDSAVDLASELDQVAQQTYLIHRRDQFRALEQSVVALNQTGVIKKTPQKISQVDRTVDGRLNLTLSHVKNNEKQEKLVVDRLVVQYGFLTKGQADQTWQVDLDRDVNGLQVTEQIKTKATGLFAIGDVSSYPGHVDLLATGFGQGPAAVNAAIDYFDPNRGGPGHSSSLPI